MSEEDYLGLIFLNQALQKIAFFPLKQCQDTGDTNISPHAVHIFPDVIDVSVMIQYEQ